MSVCVDIYSLLYRYNLLSLYIVNGMDMFSGLTIWYWTGNFCTLPEGKLFLPLSAFLVAHSSLPRVEDP